MLKLHSEMHKHLIGATIDESRNCRYQKQVISYQQTTTHYLLLRYQIEKDNFPSLLPID
jgi:hypothetical protein